MYRTEEEVSHVSSELVAKVREKLVEFLSRVPEVSSRKEEKVNYSRVRGGFVSESSMWAPGRIAVVDGGSNIISLNAGFLGIVASLGIIVEGDRVVRRVVAEPEIVPSNPEELGLYETLDQIVSVLDKIREAKVFETATKLLNWNPELLIIDGPLIPYGALAKVATELRIEKAALKRYRGAVIRLHRESLKTKTSVIGFVKRPRSKYLREILGFKDIYDHVVLSATLREGEYYPNPPMEVPASPEWFHELDIVKLVREVKPKFTFIRMNKSLPPFRVDFGHLTRGYAEILNYLYSTRTRDGIPYVIMKADEEVKITRKLIRELYEDALHSCIVKYFEKGFHTLIPVLPEYGGVW